MILQPRLTHRHLTLLCLLRQRQHNQMVRLVRETGQVRSNVHYYLKFLKRWGLVTWGQGKCNTFQLTRWGQDAIGDCYLIQEGERVSVGRLVRRY